MKSKDGKSQTREEKRREEKKEDHKRESLRRKKIQVREKVGKSRNTVFFPMICGSGGSKSRLAKAVGAEPSGQMRDEKLHAVVARSTFASEKAKNTSRSEHFLKLVEKVHGVVARNTFRSQNRQNTSGSDHLELAMSKKCTPLWREAHFEVRMHKTHMLRTTFGS